MRKSRSAEEQRVAILREADRTSVDEPAKKNQTSEQSTYAWRGDLGAMDLVDVKRLRLLGS